MASRQTTVFGVRPYAKRLENIYESMCDGDHYAHAVNELRGLLFVCLNDEFMYRQFILQCCYGGDESEEMRRMVIGAMRNFATTADVFVNAFAFDGGMGRCVAPLLGLGDNMVGFLDEDHGAGTFGAVENENSPIEREVEWPSPMESPSSPTDALMLERAIAMSLGQEEDDNFDDNYNFVD